jgi:hypothetical protein
VNARAGLRIIVALAAVVAGAGALALFRPGYSPDEEFTLFAVRGIHAHGLPLLPSGLLYDRGLLYSYASWLAAALTGLELPAFRTLSLLSATATLALGYSLIRKVASPAAGAAAAGLVATAVAFWAVATTGRFYAPFLLTCVAVLAVLARPQPSSLALFTVAFVSRLTHELAFTVMAIPVAALVLTWTAERPTRASRRDWAMAGAAILLGLGTAQAVLMSLHFLMPPSDGGGTMIARFFLWQVLNLFERPHGAPVGVVLSALIVSWLVAPGKAAHSLAAALAAAGAVVAIALARGGLDNGLAYPLDMFWSLAGAHPVMVWMAMALLVARLCGAGGEWPAGERAAHMGWVAWVLWFGVIESGITINYVLLPTVCLMAAMGIDLVAIGQQTAAIWPGRRGQLTRAALVGAALMVVSDQWRGTGSLPERLAAARPTIEITGIEAIRNSLQPTDRVACTDELACLVLVGRVDAWLALDDYVRERFVVMRGRQPVGVYAGAPAVLSPSGLLAPGPDGIAPSRVIVVDVFKEYPVGNSITWLPRALTADGLGSRTLLETPQARIVEVLRRAGLPSRAAGTAVPTLRSDGGATGLQPRVIARRQPGRPVPAVTAAPAATRGQVKRSTTDSRRAVSTYASSGRLRSASSISPGRARVIGCRGVKSVQQSSSGWIEMP